MMQNKILKDRNGREIKYLGQDEAHKILSLLKGQYHLYAEVLWNTGMRSGEALELTPQAINYDDNTITVRSLMKKDKLPKKGKDLKNEIMGLSLAVKKAPGSEVLIGKLEQAKKDLSEIEREPAITQYRVIPILAELKDKIVSHCTGAGIKRNDRIFPFTHTNAYLVIRKAAEEAGIEKGRGIPSAFRHGYAVNATRAGMPPAVLRSLMGHTNIVSTLVYTNVLEQDAREYLERMKF
ncbi:MAG: tyrosine-type recombinase/integrase [Syntrophales bacterium]|nr:tyrosine-type recombinase/integrase [Syntrophales bacterium]